MTHMLLDKGNPYQEGLPETLQLDWEDFECGFSPGNEQALGRVAEWAVFAYMAADCNLAAYMFDNLLEMKRVGSGETVHVMALFDGPLLTDSFFARLNPNTKLSEDIIFRFNELRTNDAATLTMAMQVASAYPAKHRILLLGGHGAGWRGLLLDQNIGMRYQNEPGRLVRPGPESACNARLRDCLTRAQDRLNLEIEKQKTPVHYDILAFDACYMGSIEAVAQFAEYGDLLVVSEDQVPGEGFAYGSILTHLLHNPAQSPLELATSIVTETDRFYDSPDASRRVTLAALESSQLTRFSQSFVGLVQALGEMDEPAIFAAVGNALDKSWAFDSTGTIDLKGFVQKLLESPLPAPVKEAAGNVLEDWSKLTVAFTGGGTAQSTNGLSVYAPAAKDFDPAYIEASNQFRLDLGIWALFLASYYLKLLGSEATGNPLIQAIARTMQDLTAKGIYKPQDSAKTA
jgi:hypothetical protein